MKTYKKDKKRMMLVLLNGREIPYTTEVISWPSRGEIRIALKRNPRISREDFGGEIVGDELMPELILRFWKGPRRVVATMLLPERRMSLLRAKR